MDSVKRRLVYVADDSEILFDNLTGESPPMPRASRLSRIHVTASSDDDDPPGLSIPMPLPVGAAAVAAASAVAAAADADVDPLLLVSYDGHLLADGSGRLHRPRNAAEASQLRLALHVCRTYLRDFAKTDASPDPLTPHTPSSSSVSGSVSGSESDEDGDYDDEASASDEETESDDGSRARRRRKAARKQQPRRRGGSDGTSDTEDPDDPRLRTVAQLKEALRAKELPVTGNKATLVARLQAQASCVRSSKRQRNDSESALPEGSAPALDPTKAPTPSVEPKAASRTSEQSVGPVAPANETPSPQQQADLSVTGASSEGFKSPPSTRSSRGGLWGTIVNVGSLFFRPSASFAAAPPSPATGLSDNDDSASRPSAKRSRFL